jgi:hypothetical protein
MAGRAKKAVVPRRDGSTPTRGPFAAAATA